MKHSISQTSAHQVTDNATSGKSFFALVENAPDIICRFDRDHYHLYTNPAIEKITGYPPAQFIGKKTTDIMPQKFAEFWNEKIDLVFATKKQIMFEFNFPTAIGVRYFQSSVVPEFDEKGNIETVLSISRDITPLREAE